MDKILAKKSLASWLAKLDGYTIYAPVPDTDQEDLWNYQEITDLDRIDLGHPNTVQSPKKIIFPQKETFFRFMTGEDGSPEMTPTIPDPEPFLMLGVRPCDARALTLYDKVFAGDYTDPYYWARRDKAILVGLACVTPPSPNCFCPSVGGSPFSQEGLDLLMTDLGDRFHISSLTKKGDKLLEAGKTLFKPSTAKDKQAVQKARSEAEKKIQRQVKGLDKVPAKLKGMFESDFWEKEAMACLRCGICTYLCPTCHCFDISDEMSSSSPPTGKRVRTWDTCQFPDFTMHSSGHNPRPHKASRLRQRIMHKFYYFVENFDAYQCTGCGRCVSQCPVGIDIIEVLAKVRDYG